MFVSNLCSSVLLFVDDERLERGQAGQFFELVERVKL